MKRSAVPRARLIDPEPQSHLTGIPRRSSVLRKMFSIYIFISRHPLITLISLVILYRLLTSDVEDDDDILRVVISSLLLKSDDPHQKPQHFPEEPAPSSSGRRGGKRTRVILLAYARSSLVRFPNSLASKSGLGNLTRSSPLFSHHLPISYFRSGSSYVGQLLTAAPNSFYYYEPLYALRPK